MAPLQQERKVPIPNPQSSDLTGEEVVISGISGQFPKSMNVMEFMNNLYNKVDMVTKHIPNFEHADLTQYTGKLSEVIKFDAQFFRVTHNQAESMDPMCRKLMEQAYGALYDAGVNPISCKGKKIGVFTAVYNIDTCKFVTSNLKKNHFVISGSCKTMHANRISYWLDAKGPSLTFDNPAGAVIALQYALSCINTGICDAAIVGSGELPVDPILNINMRNAGILSLDGKTRCFDKNGDGSAISQAVGVLFLQKAKDAKRIYAEICSTSIEYGLKEGDSFNQQRDPKQLADFINNVYSKSGLLPNKVEYVEAHGAAHPQADANELEAIAEVFGKQKPILVGCVKSNMGNSIPVSAICSIIKLCLAYHKGELPGNLHYDDPLDIPAINSGTVEVLTNNKKTNRGMTALNSFFHTGINGHIVLKGHSKRKDLNQYKINFPRLVLVSGRHEKAVEKIFDSLKNMSIDPEFIGMLNDVYELETPGFTCRGYTILDTTQEQTISLAQSAELNQEAAPPLWLMYSGMGSQWAGMGKELMRVPIFAAAIEKCHKILEPKGLDVVKIITSPDKTLFDNVLNCFIGIAAVQIGLTNILKELGVIADNIIGHSLGELGCAYYDGCLTDEEMILAVHARGLVSIQTKLIKGSMAAVGLGYIDMLPLCPPNIEIACHNSSSVCTISGPADVMKTFVAELSAKGIFAREVPCGNIAYHSSYIQDAGPEFLVQLKKIIKHPIKRSKKWISTSLTDDQQKEDIAELCSAEYHTNNLLSPVYFEEAARLIPENAVVIEVAPHGLMQAILKRSHPNCTHIPLTRRDHDNPVKFLLEAIGKLYQMGYNPKVNTMYPNIEYPVSAETSPLSHLVEWYHEEDWSYSVESINPKRNKRTAALRSLVISKEDDDFKFLTGHLREGIMVLPEAAVLFFVWETLAMFKKVDYTEVSVVYRDVHFHAEVDFGLEDSVHFKISINKGNNYFEMTRGDDIIASGYISTLDNLKSNNDIIKTKSSETETSSEETNIDIDLNSDDIYKIFKLKGYCYETDFQMIHSTYQQNFTKIKMTGNWITFLDSLIQYNILARDYDGVSLPKIIKTLTIDMTDSFFNNSNNFINAYIDIESGVTTCGGIKIDPIIFIDKPKLETAPDVLDAISFGKIHKTNKIQEYQLINAKIGSIEGIEWEEVDIINPVKVCYAAPTMKDVQNAIGIGDTKRSFGMDFSGVDSKGDRLMGLVAGGALATTVEKDVDFLWPVPKHWTLEEAATVPLPYIHAYYCLLIRGRLQKGQTVFVTGGAGALGQAVISICLALGCNVYTSVCNIHKKRFLKRLFPLLIESNIGYSRDDRFYNTVVCNSNNKRCDYVINCTTGYVRELAMKCVGFTGHFLDVTDYDQKQNRDFGMLYLDEDRVYVTVDLSCIFRPENIEEKKLLHKVFSEGIANGIVKPLSHVVYSANDVKKAFRLISQSKHRGRVLIKMRDTEISMIQPSILLRMTYSANNIYLVVCDASELGIQLANHLITRGARRLLLHLKTKATRFIQTQLAKWANMGASIRISTANLEDEKDCLKILDSTDKLHGIFIIKPKIEGENKIFGTVVANLDDVSRNNYSEIEHFVILARNPKNEADQLITTVLENICKRRAKTGLPALIIRAELEHYKEHNDLSIIRPTTVDTALKAMEISLKRNCTNVVAYNTTSDENELLEKITKIIGINLDAVDDTVRIKEFVCNDVNIEEIKIAVKETCNHEFSSEHIKKMTINSLRNVCKIITNANTKFEDGLSAFYNFVDNDIFNATEIFEPIPTLSSSAEEAINLHAKATNIMLIPGFEGHHRIFKPMCDSLKIRATVLQLGPDTSNDSIQQIAFNLKQRFKSRFTLEPKFYLLGYSFGVNVALEIAALLEKDGLVGVVYCLDSSPDALRVQLDAYLGKLSDDQLQNAIIKHMFHLISGQSNFSFKEEIQKSNDWDEKITKCVEKLKDYVTISNEFKKDIINTFYKRICFTKSYKPDFKLESDIVLLKGISHPNAEKLENDYGLSKYAQNPVNVFSINSDLVSAPYDRRVANIVNKFLEPALIKEFKANNLCENYSFITY